MQICTMEILRSGPLTYSTIMMVRILRTTTAPSSTFTTAVSFAITKGTNEGYGHQRMFGSLAWGSGALLAGYMIDSIGMHAIFIYTYFFNICNFCLVLFGVPADWRVKDANELSEKDDKPHVLGPAEKEAQFSAISIEGGGGGGGGGASFSKPITNDSKKSIPVVDLSKAMTFATYVSEVKQFFKNKACRVLLLNAFCYGVVMTVLDGYLYLSLEKDFHLSRTFNGFCTTVSALSDVPFFWVSEYVITKYGHHQVLMFAQLCCVARLLMLSLLSTDWEYSAVAIAMIQPIHGANFALFWAATVDMIKRLAPPDLTASCVGSLNMFYFTLAGVLGNVLWGFIYDLYGIYYVYLIAAFFLLGVTYYFSLFGGVLAEGLAGSPGTEGGSKPQLAAAATVTASGSSMLDEISTRKRTI